jgi:hypothetical protein
MANGLQFHYAPAGDMGRGDIFPILYHLYKEAICGALVVQADDCERRIVVEDGKVIFASSDLKDEAFGDYLLNRRYIDPKLYDTISRYMLENQKRFGRALIEMGHFSYDQIWTWIPQHLREIVFTFFNIDAGYYRVLVNREPSVENIVLDLDILNLMVEGIRVFKFTDFLVEQFKNVENLYIHDHRLISQLKLKPYEVHVFDLVKRESRLDKILHWSELLEVDTLRFLYLFMVMEIISTKKVPEKPETIPEMESIARHCSFTSFDEALRYYNLKYELIFKIMSKEIGPIALSLISKAVEDIIENLPNYFQKIQFNSDGTINEELFLKTVWYHDFDQHISDFLRGLEEILYTEIYAVKKHLGVDFEQQVLRWINGIGN